MLISSAGDILNASAKGWEGGSDNDKVSTWGRGSLNQFSPKMSTALRDRSPMSNCQAKTFVDRLVCSWRGKRQVELKSCFTLTSILDKRETWSNVVLSSKVATPAARYFFKVSMILLASASLSSCGEEHKGKKLFSTNQTYSFHYISNKIRINTRAFSTIRKSSTTGRPRSVRVTVVVIEIWVLIFCTQ